MARPLFGQFIGSGVADALTDGNAHVLFIGDSLTVDHVNARIPGGIVREWGVKTAPVVGVVCAPSSGPTDQWGRSFAGTSNQESATVRPGPGVLITVSGGSGIFTFGVEVTEAVSGAKGLFVEEAGGKMRLLYGLGHTTPFTGGQTLTAGVSTRDGGALEIATVDHRGLPRNVFPGPQHLQQAVGDVATSTSLFRSLLSNTGLYPQGDWTASLDITARSIYWGHATAFNAKLRPIRNSVAVDGGIEHDQRTDSGITTFEVLLGNGAGVPCEASWQGLATNETGQGTLFHGGLFYRPGVASGLSLQSISLGGDGIQAALSANRCSNANWAAWLGACRRPEADTLVVVIWYGQNDAAMAQVIFEDRLQGIINRIRSLDAEVHGYSAIKFILVSSYNTGAAHLDGKAQACWNVAQANPGFCAFANLYDLYDAAYVAANTSDGIHPTLAFAQEIASDLADEIETPTVDNPPAPAVIARIEAPFDRSLRPKRAVQVLKPVDAADDALVLPTPGALPAGVVAVGSARRLLALPVGQGNDGAPTYLVVGFARFGDAEQYLPIVLAQGSAVLDSGLPISADMAAALPSGNLADCFLADALTPSGETNNRYSANHPEWGEHETGANQPAGVLIDVSDVQYVVALTKINTATASGMLGLFS